MHCYTDLFAVLEPTRQYFSATKHFNLNERSAQCYSSSVRRKVQEPPSPSNPPLHFTKKTCFMLIGALFFYFWVQITQLLLFARTISVSLLSLVEKGHCLSSTDTCRTPTVSVIASIYGEQKTHSLVFLLALWNNTIFPSCEALICCLTKICHVLCVSFEWYIFVLQCSRLQGSRADFELLCYLFTSQVHFFQVILFDVFYNVCLQA